LLIDPLSAGLQPEWVAHHRIPCCPIDLLGGVVRDEAMKQVVPHVLPSKLVLLVAYETCFFPVTATAMPDFQADREYDVGPHRLVQGLYPHTCGRGQILVDLCTAFLRRFRLSPRGRSSDHLHLQRRQRERMPPECSVLSSHWASLDEMEQTPFCLHLALALAFQSIEASRQSCPEHLFVASSLLSPLLAR
jgi:hypothetical protein